MNFAGFVPVTEFQPVGPAAKMRVIFQPLRGQIPDVLFNRQLRCCGGPDSRHNIAKGNIAAEAAKTYQGEITVAKDFMTIEI